MNPYHLNFTKMDGARPATNGNLKIWACFHGNHETFWKIIKTTFLLITSHPMKIYSYKMSQMNAHEKSIIGNIRYMQIT